MITCSQTKRINRLRKLREVEKIGIKELLKVDRSWLNAGMKEFSERVGNIKDFCTKIIRRKIGSGNI